MNDLVLFGKAISDATRVRVLLALREGELCVCELADAMELSQSTLSNHLQVIRQAGLVSTRQAGKWIYYDLEPEQKAVLEAVFARHQTALKTDGRLQRDMARLQQRLALRQDGCCVVGFVPEDSITAKNQKSNGKTTQKTSRR